MRSINKYLIEHNIKPSYQRIKILEYLKDNKNHPTIDVIYNELVDDIPTLSKTTVYNTLSMYLKKGIVSLIAIDEKTARYDYNTSPHGHFKCTKCGMVYDFDVDLEMIETESTKKELQGYKIDERHVYYWGNCKNCNDKIKEDNNEKDI